MLSMLPLRTAFVPVACSFFFKSLFKQHTFGIRISNLVN